jgi:hypothetical protein
MKGSILYPIEKSWWWLSRMNDDWWLRNHVMESNCFCLLWQFWESENYSTSSVLITAEIVYETRTLSSSQNCCRNVIVPFIYEKHLKHHTVFNLVDKPLLQLRIMPTKFMGMKNIKRISFRISNRIRCFGTSPGNDPMDLMKESFFKRKLCDESGYRLPNVHWTMSIAFSSEDSKKVGIVLLCF